MWVKSFGDTGHLRLQRADNLVLAGWPQPVISREQNCLPIAVITNEKSKGDLVEAVTVIGKPWEQKNCGVGEGLEAWQSETLQNHKVLAGAQDLGRVPTRLSLT
jgi:hypothetical protein